MDISHTRAQVYIVLGSKSFRALCDLGSSVSVIPILLYSFLNLVHDPYGFCKFTTSLNSMGSNILFRFFVKILRISISIVFVLAIICFT
jgi:hypothetical protein